MLNGRPGISVAVRKQTGVNTVATIDAIKARMAEIRQTLPPNFEVRLIRDDSEFIRASLHAIEEHLVLGGFLAAIIVLLFLRNFRSTIIAAVAIPSSIIGAFAAMAVLGFTLNQMTMLALTLMVGIVIDDAIVVLENIYRFVEEKGMPPFQAAIEGTREIGLAVMATTLSLLAVFVPVGFMGGIVGRFMSSFGLTAAAAIAISLLVSFTLTPMLAARWIKQTPDHKPHDDSRNGFYGRIDAFYTALLRWSMAHRWVVVATCLLVAASTYPLFKMSGVNFVPDEDESRFQINVRLPVGSSLAATQSLLDRIARDVREQLPGVSDTLAIAGFGGGGGAGNQRDDVRAAEAAGGARSISQQEIAFAARRLVAPYRKQAVISVQASQGLNIGGGRGGGGGGLQYALVGPDLEKLDEYTQKALEIIQKDPRVVDADRGYLPGRPELRITIDRKRAADLGIRVQDVSQTVNALMAGQEVTTYNAASDQYDVVLKAMDSFRRTPETLAQATVRGPSSPGAPGGALMPLRNLVTFNEGIGTELDRSLEPAASDHGAGQHGAGRVAGGSAAGGAGSVRQGRHGARLFAAIERSVARAGPRDVLLRHRVPAVVHLHVHGAGGAVRIVHPSGDDSADAAAVGAVRAARIAAVRPGAQHLFGARRAAAVRHREEERDSADRSHDRAARQGHGARTTRSSRPIAIVCGRS